MAERQFVACVFRPGDRRAYTYHWEGEPLASGERVRVPGRSGESIVTVQSTSWANPPYETKAIFGKVEEPAPPPQGALFPEAGNADPS